MASTTRQIKSTLTCRCEGSSGTNVMTFVFAHTDQVAGQLAIEQELAWHHTFFLSPADRLPAARTS